MTDTILGRQLDEYRLLNLLGKGGMARVYLGLDVRLKRHVAIKVIDRPFRSDDQYIQRFEREAQAVAQLEHSHIIRLYRYGETDDLLYIAMQYVEGADLDTLLSSYRKDGTLLEAEDALRIIDQVGQALDYAHSRGVIHRDVKPSNIILDNQGTAYLADFGLALFEETGTRGEVFGTPAYISPEQAQSSNLVVPQSDIYSLGVVVYELFTGELPFRGEQPLEIALQHLRDDPPSPREFRPDLSPEVEAVILKTLAKEPRDRYQSCAALTAALRATLNEAPVIAPPPAAVTPDTQRSLPERVSILLADDVPFGARNGGAAAPPPTGPLTVQRPVAAPAPAAQPQGVPLIGCIVAAVLMLLLLGAGISLLMGGDDEDPQISVPPDSSTSSSTEIGSNDENPTEEETPSGDENPAGSETETPSATAAATPTTGASIPPTAETIEQQPTPVPTAAPTKAPIRLMLYANKEDSLFVYNGGIVPIPLGPFRFGDGDEALNGTDWDVEVLQPGYCVAAWKENGNPQPPSVTCSVVGERIEREGKEIFWDKDFPVYFGSQQIGTCQESDDRVQCEIQVLELPLSQAEDD